LADATWAIHESSAEGFWCVTSRVAWLLEAKLRSVDDEERGKGEGKVREWSRGRADAWRARLGRRHVVERRTFRDHSVCWRYNTAGLQALCFGF